ncbi:MAG: enoyl-CoA hydratase/isomerase family protein [Gammaproteobacteria bacterium]|nr:enoyl-CoA hydratase/isomerase family protein [Gammaproteobacteria bacterium]
MSEPVVLVERHDRVAVLRLNRPKALNALNLETVSALQTQLQALDADESVGCMILTGNDKAFAAGADIKEMVDKSYKDALRDDFMNDAWVGPSQVRTPIIAVVSGYALGGGCELAMMCDFIVASETAQFGQPEIKIGTIPGMGGGQRMARLIGKAKAMEMVLTGRMMGAEEAERSGLVARVFPQDVVWDEAMKIATQIAGLSAPVTRMAKAAVNVALETSLEAGLDYERKLFQGTFALDDRREGMAAFAEKRAPNWRHQ